jgi:hypothetical protein
MYEPYPFLTIKAYDPFFDEIRLVDFSGSATADAVEPLDEVCGFNYVTDH